VSGEVVHNHGTEDGPGLACPERRTADGALRGACTDETTTEWGVRWPWTTVIEPNAGEGSARWFAANMHTRDGVVVSRQVTEWKEA